MTFGEYLNRCSQGPWLDAKNWWSKKYGEKQDICVVSDTEKKRVILQWKQQPRPMIKDNVTKNETVSA